METTILLISNFLYLVESYNGPILSIPRVTPDDLGAYLCIAKNGVQPSMSKRVVVYVQCNYFSYILKRIIIHFEVKLIIFLLLITKSILQHNHKRILTLSERLTSNSSYRFRVLPKYLFDEYLYHNLLIYFCSSCSCGFCIKKDSWSARWKIS